MKNRVHSREVEAAARRLLNERGVTIPEIADIVYEMQIPFSPGLTKDECIESVDAVLMKREIQHAILVGVELDILAEQKSFLNLCRALWNKTKGCSAWMKRSH